MKNRTLFLLLLALCPLAFLTFMSVWEFFTVPPRSMPNDSAMIQRLAQDFAVSQNQAKTAAALQAGLSEVHLILPVDMSESKFHQNMARYESYAAKLQYVRDWNAVAGNMADMLQPLRRINSDSLHDLENVTRENLELSQGAAKSIQKAKLRFSRYGRELNSSLEDLREKNPRTPLAKNTENCVLKLTEMQSLVSERIGRAQEIHQLKVSFLDARNAFEAEDYAASNKLCRKILASKILDETFRKSVAKINCQARSKLALAELEEIENSIPSLETKIEKIQELNQNVRDSGKILDRDEFQELAKEYREKANETLIQHIEEMCVSEIEDLLGQLVKTPPATFRDSLQDAGEILEKLNAMEKKLRESIDVLDQIPRADEFKKRLKEAISAILEERLPAEAAGDEKIQEAELRNGKIVSGYFREVSENGRIVGFKIYPSFEEFQNPTASIGMTSVDEFHVLPGKSLEARAAEEYLDARKELLRNIAKRSAWNEFLGKCERLDSDLKKWEESSNLKARFSLKKPVAIAKGTLKEENWSVLEDIFR
ncbi:MAG: hypothetical protein E7028_04760 [Planctomycetaceae bacterium]|nr:hypothetical protein [Planctomycetaceae bacterium]